MKAADLVKALGVAIAVIVITMAASFPMVAFYAFVVEPGHPQAFYTEAAQWIAPWSSHILGPICFFGFNFWLARRSADRHATAFAVTTLVMYLIVDLAMLPLMGLPILGAVSVVFILSFAGKATGALLGAHLGSRTRTKATA